MRCRNVEKKCGKFKIKEVHYLGHKSKCSNILKAICDGSVNQGTFILYIEVYILCMLYI